MTAHAQPEGSTVGGASFEDVHFDADAHSADAIQRAAYKFSDRFSMELTREGRSFRCRLWFSEGGPPQEMLGDFRTEVLDQVLRERIRNETEAVRNLILALAFANAPMDDESDR